MDIRFGVNTWLWTAPFDSRQLELFAKVRAMGFEVIEIPIENPSDFDVNGVRASLEAHGLEPVIVGVFSEDRDLSSEHTAVKDNGFSYVNSCLEIGHGLGAKIFTGPAYSAVGKARSLPDDQRKAEWDRAVGNIRELSILAADQGMVIALEPLNRFESDMVNNSYDVLRFINEVDHSSVGVAFDGFHMHIEETSIEAAIRRVSDRLVYVQVSESHRGVPGTGQFDWAGLKRGLEAINYQGTVAIESFSPGCSSLAEAVCIWKPLAVNQDAFAMDGIAFLRKWAGN